MTHFVTLGLFKKISDVFSKLLSMWPREKFFFQKFKIFPSYSDLELNFSGLLAAKSWKFGQTTVRCAQKNFLGKTLFYKKKLSSFSNIEPNMFEKWQFFAAFYKLQITWPEKFFSESFSEVRVAILSILDFWQRQFGAIVKTAFYERWGSFWKKKDFFRKICFPCFSDLDQTFPGFLAKVFGRVAELPLKEPRGTFWEQCFFWKKSFPDFETKTFGKGQIFSAAFSKLH